MRHRHLEDQDQTVFHQLIGRYTFAHTIFLLHRRKASRYQKYVTGSWFFLELYMLIPFLVMRKRKLKNFLLLNKFIERHSLQSLE